MSQSISFDKNRETDSLFFLTEQLVYMSSGTSDQRSTQEAIMEATYRALCRHGYADLTIQVIADEFEKSKSLLYYHYETKDELLLALLEYLLDQFSVEEMIDMENDPETQLQSLIDGLLPESIDEDRRELQTALLELRSQAPIDEAYREQFTRADQLLRDTVAGILERGISDGTFRDVDIDQSSELLVSAINGVRLQRATTNTEDTVMKTREGVETHIRSQLLD